MNRLTWHEVGMILLYAERLGKEKNKAICTALHLALEELGKPNVFECLVPSEYGQTSLHMWVQAVFSKWGKRSECASYPVAAPNMNPIRAFHHLPYWEGEYGKNRQELMNLLKDTALQLARLKEHGL